MLKRLIKSLQPFSAKKTKTSPGVVPKEKHGISRDAIHSNALKVIRRLSESGFQGYLVGGSVRDLLLGGDPKDFDVATDAKPEQVRKLFSNSRIIGRRFRIVHVRFGREIIEVTTFRGHDNDSSHQKKSETGQLLRDNVFGDLQSDAYRRDFTANALYYSNDGEIIDYVNGIDDIKKHQLRMIGSPNTRYQEDPVRLLRAVRFASKLGFSIEKETAKPIHEQGHLLEHIAPARLFDEVNKLLLGGYATASYNELCNRQLFQHLFPETYNAIEHKPNWAEFVALALLNTDKRIRTNKHVTPAFLFAALLWPALIESINEKNNRPKLEAFHIGCREVLDATLKRIMIPKRFIIPMRQIWELQWRLPNRLGNKAFTSLEHPKFRAGYDFLLLREESGEDLESLGAWWTEFQFAENDKQQAMIQALQPQKKNRRPRRRRNNVNTQTQDS